MNKKGSALIFVSLLLSFVSIIAILFTRNAMLYYGFAVDRIHHVRSQHALDALTYYGMSRSLSLENDWHARFEKWPPAHGSYQGTVQAVLKDRKWHIQSELFQNKLSLGKTRCILYVSEKKETRVEGWSYL